MDHGFNTWRKRERERERESMICVTYSQIMINTFALMLCFYSTFYSLDAGRGLLHTVTKQRWPRTTVPFV